MANFSFAAVAGELPEVDEKGVTFEDKQLSWDTAADVKDVVAALTNTPVVHYLKLEGNTLGVEAAAAIGAALEKHPEFKKALWRNMFTRRLKSEIPVALKHLGGGLMTANAQLTVLDLSDNALGPNGMVGLEDLLRSRVCYTLQELRLNNCGLGIGGGQMLSKALLDCHASSTAAGTPLTLRVFITGRNRLENDGAKAIAKIFSTLKTLEEIAMPQNSIYHHGIGALAEGFKLNPNLKVLNLNDNTVTEKGAAPLAEAFAHTTNLREINFGDCLLKTNGAYLFAAALEDSHNDLEVVDLGYNEIGPDGGEMLAQAMKNKKKLKKLFLDGNQFGFEGRERIKEAMLESTNPDALCEFEEDQSEGEEDEEDGSEEQSEGEDEDEVYGDHHNEDTTEEADGYENYNDEDEAEETAYTTTQAFTTKLLNPNESFVSTTSGDLTKTPATTVESFCLSQKPCTLQMFDSLEAENRLAEFKNVIDKFDGDNHLLLLVFTALKCANLSQSSKPALELATQLFQECSEYAIRTNQERRILNYLLIQLGMLRTEDKFKPMYNPETCRYAIREAIKGNKIKSEVMRDSFEAFLNPTTM